MVAGWVLACAKSPKPHLDSPAPLLCREVLETLGYEIRLRHSRVVPVELRVLHEDLLVRKSGC